MNFSTIVLPKLHLSGARLLNNKDYLICSISVRLWNGVVRMYRIVMAQSNQQQSNYKNSDNNVWRKGK